MSWHLAAALCTDLRAEELPQWLGTLDAQERVTVALELLRQSGGVDGAHHKAWVLDQLARVLAGAGYAALVQGEVERGYDWDEGIAP